jgi:hypothetical protein
MLKTLFATLLLAATTSVLAQAPAAPAEGKERRHARPDCSKAADPKACEEKMRARHERHEKMKAAHAKARQSCEGKKGDEQRACMTSAMCAQAADPAKCQERAKARADKHKQRMEKRQQEKKTS